MSGDVERFLLEIVDGPPEGVYTQFGALPVWAKHVAAEVLDLRRRLANKDIDIENSALVCQARVRAIDIDSGVISPDEARRQVSEYYGLAGDISPISEPPVEEHWSVDRKISMSEGRYPGSEANPDYARSNAPLEFPDAGALDKYEQVRDEQLGPMGAHGEVRVTLKGKAPPDPDGEVVGGGPGKCLIDSIDVVCAHPPSDGRLIARVNEDRTGFSLEVSPSDEDSGETP